MQGLIRTYSGEWIDPLNIDPEKVHAVDIAHHLALVNRFNGAVKEPLNVAQHSWWVARLVADHGPQVELQALLHDASEAYLGDVTKWLKQADCMAGYRDAEDRAHAAIMSAFGLPAELHPAITDADRIMVIVEGRYGFEDPDWPHVEQYAALSAYDRERVSEWVPWTWEDSEAFFLDRLDNIMLALKD